MAAIGPAVWLDIRCAVMTRSLAINYAAVSAALTVFFVWLWQLVSGAPAGPEDPRALLPALFALVALTALVWVLMLLARNISVALGKVTVSYYRNYRDDVPPEWIERPARTFMNLLEAPVLFYVACLVMLVTEQCDRAQVLLAGTFVATASCTPPSISESTTCRRASAHTSRAASRSACSGCGWPGWSCSRRREPPA